MTPFPSGFFARLAGRLRLRRFDAAAGGRRWQGSQTFGAINSEVGAAAGPVRRRASYYSRNSPWITNAVNAIVSGAVGAGIVPQSQHPDPDVRALVHEAWNRWTADADADGVLPFEGMQALAVRTLVETGECFAHFYPTPAGLRVRLLDAEMVPADYGLALGENGRVLQGIELDADGGRVAYHILKNRPDLLPSFSALDLIRVPAENVAHLFAPVAAGQLRGVSFLAPVLLRLHELDLYEDAQLVRQKVAALFAGFVVDAAGTGGGFDGTTTAPNVMTTGMEPGTLKRLPPGTDVRFAEPATIGDAVPFLQLQLRSIAAGLGVPEYLLTGDLSQANYSSLRAALVEFRARLEQLQYSVIVHQLLRPVWRAWIVTEVLGGRLAGNVDELLACEWVTPQQSWVDPQKDAEAAQIALANGFTSRRKIVAALGYDVEQLDAEIAADDARARALGLTFGAVAPPPASTAARDTPPRSLREVPHAA